MQAEHAFDASDLGTVVVVPVINPDSAARLAAFAALIAVRDGGVVVPVSVLPPEAAESQRSGAAVALERAVNAARVIGVRTDTVTAVGTSVVEAVVGVMEARTATLAVVGWQGPDAEGNVLGQLVDALLRRVRIPLVVVRSGHQPMDRILLPLSDDDLAPHRRGGVELAAAVVDRLAVGRGIPAIVARHGSRSIDLPPAVRGLGRVRLPEDEPPHRGPQGEVEGELVVLQAMPTVDELRAATSQLATAAAGTWLVLVIEPASSPIPTIAAGVRNEGDGRQLPFIPSGEPLLYALNLDVSRADGRPVELAVVEEVLVAAGATVEVHEDQEGTLLRVELWAVSAHAAATRVLSALHESDELADTAITYRVGAAADRLLSRSR